VLTKTKTVFMVVEFVCIIGASPRNSLPSGDAPFAELNGGTNVHVG